MSKAKSQFTEGYGVFFCESDKNRVVSENPAVHQLVSLGLRQNKKRAHLLVSEVLGKHIPQDPRVIVYAGHLLGAKVGTVLHPSLEYIESVEKCAQALAEFMDGERSIEDLPEIPNFVPFHEDETKSSSVVVGFAETATGLGFNVADYLNEWYIHSTRHFADRETFVAFEEEHSHATSHALVPDKNSPLSNPTLPLVLVDDEFSTGKTVLNIIRELHDKAPRDSYIIASLVDCRNSDWRSLMNSVALELGVQISTVSLADGEVYLPEGLVDAVQKDIADLPSALITSNSDEHKAIILEISVGNTIIGSTDSRCGVPAGDYMPAVPETIARLVLEDVDHGSTLVLGQEEFMHLPLLTADALTVVHDSVKSSTTTRSPIFVNDREDYPVRNGIKFLNVEGETRFAYNVLGFDSIVLVLEPGQNIESISTESGLLDTLASITQKIVVVNTTERRNHGE